MSKFNCLLLTVTLSLFSLILFNTEGDISFVKNTPAHHYKVDQSVNACAVSINNSYGEFISFDKQKRLTNYNLSFAIEPLSQAHSNSNVNYFKLCKLFDLNLTSSTIIFPFHYFL